MAMYDYRLFCSTLCDSLPRLALRADVASRGNFLLAGVHVAEAHPQAGFPLPTTRVARESHPTI